MLDFKKTKFYKYFESDLDSFSIYFPAEPEVEEHQNLNIYKAGWSGEGYLVTVSTSGFTTVKSLEEVEEIKKNPERVKEVQKRELKKSVETLKSINKVLSVRESNFFNLPSVDLVYYSMTTNPHMYVVVREFYTTERGYSITAAHKKRESAIEKFEQFISGFKLLN